LSLNALAGRSPLGGIAALFATLLLCGCVDTAVETGSQRVSGASPLRIAARPGVSPHGASLGFATLDGPSQAVSERFREHFDKAAQSRDVALAKPESAHYRLRGYLTAAPAQSGPRLSYVLDIYDRQGRRVQRLTEEVGVSPEATSWEALDEKSLAAFADRGAEDVAAFLSNTSEAVAAAEKDSGVTVVAGQAKASEDKPRAGGVAQIR
jgi:hypothetical protein